MPDPLHPLVIGAVIEKWVVRRSLIAAEEVEYQLWRGRPAQRQLDFPMATIGTHHRIERSVDSAIDPAEREARPTEFERKGPPGSRTRSRGSSPTSQASHALGAAPAYPGVGDPIAISRRVMLRVPPFALAALAVAGPNVRVVGSQRVR